MLPCFAYPTPERLSQQDGNRFGLYCLDAPGQTDFEGHLAVLAIQGDLEAQAGLRVGDHGHIISRIPTLWHGRDPGHESNG
jgi:hypothetical protein